MQKTAEKKRTFFSPNHLTSAVIYIISVFILSSVFQIIVTGIATQSIGLGFEAGVNALLHSSEVTMTDELEWAESMGSGYGNFLGYLLALIGVIIWQRNDFVTDYQAMLASKKKYAIMIPVMGVTFMLLAFGIDKLFSLWLDSSENQKTIESILYSDARVPMIIATVFFAPVVEEMIYRKTIFHCLRKYSVVSAYLASIILFVLPHMLTTQANIGIWLLTCVPYLLSAVMLCVIYHKSGYNVYASICAHMLNNILAVVLVYVWR